MHIDEMKFCNELKVICNAEIDAQNKVTCGDTSRSTREELKGFYFDKNKKIHEILEYRKSKTKWDKNISDELYNTEYKGSKWLCY
jgi:hypothetical protein